jgi:aryl-alcohol dehydrogenase-like predicted oxidoreductase
VKPLTRADGVSVGRLGLGGTSDTTPQLVDRAYRSGVDYFFTYSAAFDGMIQGLSTLGRRHREQIVIAAGDEDRNPDALTRKRDHLLGLFDTSFLDIFFVEYVSPDDKPDEVRIALDLVSKWKEAGIIRYVGASVHDRGIAGDLAESGQIDVLMHRYNMAHRKSEKSVLPQA